MASVSEGDILRKYYEEDDYHLSAEGVLKVISVMLCIISTVLFLSLGYCGGAPGLVASAATVALACAVVMATLYAGRELGLPLYAPECWLFLDIVVSAALGVLLLLTAALSLGFCELERFTDYLHGPLALVNAVTVTLSAVITYSAVMRRYDAGRGPAVEPSRPTPTELDV